MECIRECSLLEFRSNTLENVRKLYNFDKKSLNEAIDILEEWVKIQTHFLKTDFSRAYLETAIISSKGSLERAKSRLDKVCTSRTLTPQFFGDFDIAKDFKELERCYLRTTLPKLTEDYVRVYMLKINSHNVSSNFFLQCFQVGIMFAEHLKVHDYVDGFTVIADLYDVNNIAEIATKINPLEFQQGLSILMDGYGMRIRGIHLLSSSKLIEIVTKILKQVLSEKVASRIHVHSSLESLHKFIPQDILPVEYGGKERSLKKLNDEWTDALGDEKFRAYQKDMMRARTDETKRPIRASTEEYTGLPGTFRSLNVD